MSPHAAISFASLGVVLLVMLFEARLSRANERALRAQGAIEPAGDVYWAMQIAYPGGFIAMALEGALVGPAPGFTTMLGVAVLLGAKALKFWAIGSLGPRWTFRVLVPPAAIVVTRGPYSMLRHPNYVAVMGEIVGMALLVGATMTGPVVTTIFGALIWRRIRVENHALWHLPRS